MNTPTPWTDANEEDGWNPCGWAVDSNLVRELERELIAARQELAAVTEQRDEAREQRDRLAEACSPSFDTTETDAAWSAHCIDPDSASGDPWDLAKKLETELTTVTEQRDELLRYNKAFRQDTLICADCDAISKEEYDRAIEQRDGLRSAVDYASDQLTRVTEQRDEAREQRDRLAFKLLMATVGEPNSSADHCWVSEEDNF